MGMVSPNLLPAKGHEEQEYVCKRLEIIEMEGEGRGVRRTRSSLRQRGRIRTYSRRHISSAAIAKQKEKQNKEEMQGGQV